MARMVSSVSLPDFVNFNDTASLEHFKSLWRRMRASGTYDDQVRMMSVYAMESPMIYYKFTPLKTERQRAAAYNLLFEAIILAHKMVYGY